MTFPLCFAPIALSSCMTLTVLDLFSGIGGMRCGLMEALGDGATDMKCVSLDLNVFCNEVYEESFGEAPHAMDITLLSLSWFEGIAADVWTMSPPCQPYTRQGHMKGSLDDRAKPLHHLIDVLGKIEKTPKLIIIENVKNFEISDSFDQVRETLVGRGFSLYGYLLNPLYMGFPNSRLRFYLVAVADGGHVPFKIVCNDPQFPEFERIDTSMITTERRIGDFLCDSHTNPVVEQLTVPKSTLEKKSAFCFDIVSPVSRQCLCFTRSYTKYVNGTGSVLYTADHDGEMDGMRRPKFNVDSMTELGGKLRYFCPLEAARLNGFNVNEPSAPWALQFTKGCSGSIKYYRAVGNSLNPHAVAFLVRRHLSCLDQHRLV